MTQSTVREPREIREEFESLEKFGETLWRFVRIREYQGEVLFFCLFILLICGKEKFLRYVEYIITLLDI